ncbi:MAG: hypothetical protein A2Y33_09180 [Spirochaetes bacterium GWF1_51_8]|nr:MAG: hypothetical protein A2Y33_09180 [Spirochaetes bacterium GWF1_51_8]
MKQFIPYFILLTLAALTSCGPMQGMYQPGKLKDLKIAAPEQLSTSPYWTMADGTQLYHFSQGNGTPVLVLHGGPGFPYAKEWTGLEPLTEEYQFHYFHQRGCGKSDSPVWVLDSPDYFKNMTTLESKLGLGALLSDIEQIRQILNVDKLILIGHSYGGFLAALYAAEFPGHVEKMVLISPAHMIKNPKEIPGLYDLVMFNLPDSMISNYQDYMKRYFDYGNLFMHTEDTLRLLNEEFFIYYAAACSNMGLPMTPVAMDRTGGWAGHGPNFSTGERLDAAEFVKTVDIPVLILHGDKDLCPVEASKFYQSILPNSTLKVIEGADHFPYEGKPAEFAALVADFLK